MKTLAYALVLIVMLSLATASFAYGWTIPNP